MGQPSSDDPRADARASAHGSEDGPTPPTRVFGDLTGDGVVSMADVAMMLSQFGRRAEPLPDGYAPPALPLPGHGEPGTRDCYIICEGSYWWAQHCSLCGSGCKDICSYNCAYFGPECEGPVGGGGCNASFTLSGPASVLPGDGGTVAATGVGEHVWTVVEGSEVLADHQAGAHSWSFTTNPGAYITTVTVSCTHMPSPTCSETRSFTLLVRPSLIEDADGDGWSDCVEVVAGWDASAPASPGQNPPTPDTDNDGLWDAEEICRGTRVDYFDSDGDGMMDGFEVLHGYNPLAADSDGNGVPDGLEDPDGDGLINSEEDIYGGNPFIADTDGDGVPDGVEAAQGSFVDDPSDGGQPPSDEAAIRIRLTIGDHSGSRSERWALRVGPRRLSAPTGQVVERVFPFRSAREYAVRIDHLGSTLTPPDFDYTAYLTIDDASSGCVHIDDPLGILGVHDESTYNYASGRSATLIVPPVPTGWRGGGTPCEACDCDSFPLTGPNFVGVNQRDTALTLPECSSITGTSWSFPGSLIQNVRVTDTSCTFDAKNMPGEAAVRARFRVNGRLCERTHTVRIVEYSPVTIRWGC